MNEYNKTLHNQALRSSFLKSYPCKDLPLGFQNISFPAEEDCYWVFPSFDHIISDYKLDSSKMRKFFDGPKYLPSLAKVARIEPAKFKMPDLIELPGKIEVK